VTIGAAARIKQGIAVVGKDGQAPTRPASGTAGMGDVRGWRQLASTGKWSVFAVGCR
jgi:hypothetical protein